MDRDISVYPRTKLLVEQRSLQCIDRCPMDAESASQRLKLLQDISSASGIFPGSYWTPNIIKDKRIFVGGEATVYAGYHNGEAVVVRVFHPLRSSEPSEAELEYMKGVRLLLHSPNSRALINLYVILQGCNT